MKKHVLLIALAAGVFATACKKEKEVAGADDRGLTAGTINTPCTGAFGPVDLPEIISGNRTLSNDTIYLLDGKTWVKNGTLTIEPGTVIKGVKKSTPAQASGLIITTGAQINAQGTETCPIVFTSNETSPVPGDWGGVVILGNAKICTPTGTAQIEGITAAPPGVTYTYGGTTADATSGIFSYVRIEYAGAVISQGNELNGLTLGGVGCGTKLDHIATYYGADDGFEFFGGNVNAKYLLAVANHDDQFDFDFGYRGSLQFLVSIIDPAVAYANNNSNGIESDGGTGTVIIPESVCHTRPVISNMTIVGAETPTSSPLLMVRVSRETAM
ncbi:hypothetical protein [Chitinophaga barathri]|uniref:T9SS C-terminal target domain-containing protein n=1 Tax=Chitinophaga barathri TaxID=1647451 RepID=A0A3N4M5F3_9BACT|nr:hypothetical protein [Chitinophaga barathri]RPD38175.1 hypothetical protein EG028_26305 [Chitinophaga barathri]